MNHDRESAPNVCIAVREWLRGSPETCLLLVPDELRRPRAFAAALGLDRAKLWTLSAGEVRPWYEPHPHLVTTLEQGEFTDLVVVTTTGLRRFGASCPRRHVVNFLEQQLAHLEAHRALCTLAPCLDQARLHAWLWDVRSEALVPYSSNDGELAADRSISLSAASIEHTRVSAPRGSATLERRAQLRSDRAPGP